MESCTNLLHRHQYPRSIIFFLRIKQNVIYKCVALYHCRWITKVRANLLRCRWNRSSCSTSCYYYYPCLNCSNSKTSGRRARPHQSDPLCSRPLQQNVSWETTQNPSASISKVINWLFRKNQEKNFNKNHLSSIKLNNTH